MDFFRGISLRQISNNALAQIFIRFTTVAATFATIFLITYFQGFTTLGALTKITSYVSLFYLVTDFGLNTMFIKHYFSKIEDNLANLVTLRLIISILCSILAVLIALFLPSNASTETGYSWMEKVGIAIYSVTIITYATQLSLSALLQKKLSYRQALTPSILSSFLLITCVFIGAKTDNLLIILTAYILSQILYIALLTRKLNSSYKIPLKLVDLKGFSELLLKASTPLAAVLILSTLMSKSDMFILSLYQENFEVGIYSFAYKIFDFLLVIPAFLTASMYPVLLQRLETPEYEQTLKKYATLLFALSLIATPIIFFSAPLLVFLRGEYALSITPLKILSLSLPFFFLTALFQWEMIIKNQIKALIIIYTVGLLINLSLNIYYIPTYSYFAASTVTVITEGIIFLAMIVYLLLQKTKIFHKEEAK